MSDPATNARLRTWGWIDTAGRSLDWRFWFRYWQGQKHFGMPVIYEKPVRR